MSIENRYFTSDLSNRLVRFVDLLDGNHFDIGGDVVLAAKIEHLLRLGDSADRGAGETASPHDQAKRWDIERLCRRADQRKLPSTPSKLI